eukprot:CAMPEP_0114177262 /NCGR_PEP_ID=MMETSP0043_2-20121206/37926_1 /TAXON_ID=464988 /ORGANISM="Hemiselmis andersenii, Strain CCMP644" /LENGTH=212 /DNA_ID=CAMNT_0001275615 /DNA_START=46 /DNA_END=682 /DNA_ORIENTATION=+
MSSLEALISKFTLNPSSSRFRPMLDASSSPLPDLNHDSAPSPSASPQMGGASACPSPSPPPQPASHATRSQEYSPPVAPIHHAPRGGDVEGGVSHYVLLANVALVGGEGDAGAELQDRVEQGGGVVVQPLLGVRRYLPLQPQPCLAQLFSWGFGGGGQDPRGAQRTGKPSRGEVWGAGGGFASRDWDGLQPSASALGVLRLRSERVCGRILG